MTDLRTELPGPDGPLYDRAELAWLVGLAQALLGERHAAEDLAQDALLAELERPAPEGVARRAWLTGIARRLAARQRRGGSRRARRERAAAREEQLPSAASLVERLDTAERLAAAVRELPEPYRRTLLLRFLDDRDANWIAEREGARADTVRARIRRGLELLRERLDREERAKGSDWSVLLMPLARGGELSPVPAVTGVMTSILALGAMKLTLLASAVFVGVGLLFSLSETDAGSEPAADPIAAGAERPSGGLTLAAAAPSAARDSALSPPVERDVVTARTESPATAAAPDPNDDALRGVVVDAGGATIEGAQLRLLLAPGPERERLASLGRTEQDVATSDVIAKSDTYGRFEFPHTTTDALLDGRPLELRIVANGYVRRIVEDPIESSDQDGLRVVLDRGPLLLGRLVDEEGAPVPDVELVAHDTRSGISHVSPTRTRIKAAGLRTGDLESAYHDCLVTTDDTGGFELSGIPGGMLRLVSLDPRWTILDEDPVDVHQGSFTWVARPSLACRVELAEEDRDGQLVRAAFAVDLELSDGTVQPLEQWSGRGVEAAEFRFDEAALPGVVGGRYNDLDIVSATFRGSVTIDGISIEWSAEPLYDVPGFATAVVSLADFEAPEPEEPIELATLRIDVRGTDGVPVTGLVVANWTSIADGESVDGGEDVVLDTAGRAELSVAPGDVELRVHQWGSSGTQQPASAEFSVTPGTLIDVPLTLTRGATATIVRPDDWEGPWMVLAQYRTDEDEWFGAWNYGTDEAELELLALKPATWRFTLTRSQFSDEEGVVLTAEIREGEAVVVE